MEITGSIRRVTTAQRLAIASPRDGLLVYDTTLQRLALYSLATNSWLIVPADADLNVGKSAIFEDKRYQGSHGGTSTAQKWHARNLNFTRSNLIPSRVALQSFAITAADTASDYFEVAGDQTAFFPVGHKFSVRGSTGNDKEYAGAANEPYIVTAISYDGGTNRTRVSVAVVASAVADGNILSGWMVIQPGTYLVQAWPEYRYSGTTNDTSVGRLAEKTNFTYTAGYVNATGLKYTENGPSMFTVYNGNSHAPISEILVVASVEYWEVQHYILLGLADSGLGNQVNIAGYYEHYNQVVVTCLA